MNADMLAALGEPNGALTSGMERGMRVTLDQLGELVTSL
jgi:hypothetical protein